MALYGGKTDFGTHLVITFRYRLFAHNYRYRKYNVSKIVVRIEVVPSKDVLTIGGSLLRRATQSAAVAVIQGCRIFNLLTLLRLGPSL